MRHLPESTGIQRGPDAPKPTPLDTFLASHPRPKLFVAPKPVPASFAAELYYGVDAFRFINRDGAVRLGRYRTPGGGASTTWIQPIGRALNWAR